MVQIGLIGCGRLAREVHLPILTSMPGVAVAALADPDGGARAEAGRLAPGAAAYPDPAALLGDDRLDAVVACPPTAAHAEVACDVLAAGRALYLEKPIATTLADAERVVEAWRGAGVPAAMGFNYRFNPLYADLRRRLLAGEVGEVVAVRTTFSTGGGGRGWRAQRATGGGALLDLASHHVDLVRHLLEAEVAEAGARIWSRQSEDDTAVLDLRMTTGVSVQTLVSFNAAENDHVEVIGSGGALRASRYTSLAVERSGPQAAGAVSSVARHLARSAAAAPYLLQKRSEPWGEPSFRIALSRFVEAVREGLPTEPDPIDGYRCLAVLLAAETAAQGRTVVPVPEPPPSVTAPRPDGLALARPAPDVEQRAEAPALSATLVARDGLTPFRVSLDALAAQSICDRIEVVVVAPECVPLPDLPDRLRAFAGWQVVRVPEVKASGPARAVGVRAARAPVVVSIEDHCYPQPGWAAGLLAAFEAPGVVGAGPSFGNGNPGSRTSWVDYLMNFGAYADHTETRPRGGTAWHNTAYRRDVLLRYGDALGDLLDVEGPLQQDLIRRGGLLVQSGTAEVRHLNFSHPGWLLVEHVVNGRQFGAARARGWSGARRALHTAAMPLVPLARLWHVWGAARRAGRASELGGAGLPLLALALGASTVGEAVGILFGPGRAPERKFAMEYERHHYMSAPDRRRFAPAP